MRLALRISFCLSFVVWLIVPISFRLYHTGYSILKQRFPPSIPATSDFPRRGAAGTRRRSTKVTLGVGTPIKVAIDSDVRVRKVGQAIQCRTTEPVYAFDKLLIPVGMVVNGKVSAIDSVPKMVRQCRRRMRTFPQHGRRMCSSINWSWVMGGVCPRKPWLLPLRTECCGLCRRRRSQKLTSGLPVIPGAAGIGK